MFDHFTARFYPADAQEKILGPKLEATKDHKNKFELGNKMSVKLYPPIVTQDDLSPGEDNFYCLSLSPL
jgi:hypothetical protein